MVAQEQDELLTGMQGAFHALDRLQKAADSFEVRLVMSFEYIGFIALCGLKSCGGQQQPIPDGLHCCGLHFES